VAEIANTPKSVKILPLPGFFIRNTNYVIIANVNKYFPF